MAIVCACVLTAACSGSGKNATPAEAPKAEAPKTEAAADAAATEFGVKECDEYLTKYTACVSSKVPEQSRAAFVAALDQSKAQWKAAAATPEGRAGLATVCTQALAATKQSLQAYGCSW
jgi:hypothetical protein